MTSLLVFFIARKVTCLSHYMPNQSQQNRRLALAPQPGNDKPRMFRLPEHQAIINRMGFNNKGVDYLVEQVKRSQYDDVLGINIGKNKDTPEENALDDYLACLHKVHEHASYITVNISSDLNQDEVSQIAHSLIETGMDGVIATNTTLARDAVAGHQHAEEMGGLSGAVLTSQSQAITELLHQALDGKIPIVGVGGISSPADAKARYDAGASLLQVYSSFIYQGPALIKALVNA